MTNEYDLIVVGGGVIGCAVAFHAAQMGTRVAVIEAREVASGTSSQGAGLIGQVRSQAALSRLIAYGVELYASFESDGGRAPGFHQVGSLRLALTSQERARMESLAASAGDAGIPVEMIDGDRAASMFPYLQAGMISSALYCPTDGYLDAPSLALSYASRAEALGVHFVTGVPVTGILVERGTVTGVQATTGALGAGTVVLAPGPWSGFLAQAVEAVIPTVPIRHNAIHTASFGHDLTDLPVIRIPEREMYARPDGSRLIVGCFESPPKISAGLRPDEPVNSQDLVDPDLTQRCLDSASTVIPPLRGTTISRVRAGLLTYTPDGHHLLGPVEGLKGLLVATGCCAHGVAASAGIGRVIAELAAGREPAWSIDEMLISRFTDQRWSGDTLEQVCARQYENQYGHAVT